MDITARLYRIKKLLQEYSVVPKATFLNELEISEATFKRDLSYLRNRLNAPIQFDAERGGYFLAAMKGGPRHEMPGMWFDADELHALLTMQQLLEQLQPGLLTPHIQPILTRLGHLLAPPAETGIELGNRIRIHRVNARPIQPKSFGPISTSILQRRQIQIEYYNRNRNASEVRTLSPQRLTYYRDNWYLEAWCHLRTAVRCFSLDAIAGAELLDSIALDVPDADLDAVFSAGYGIFGGAQVAWATLRFSAERARWVSREQWHPQQEGTFTPDGHFILRVPYSDDRELVMDILRHMPEVVVLAPESLRLRVKSLLLQGLNAAEN